MKKILSLSIIIFGKTLFFTQQNDFFREAKTKFDIKELEIKSEYQKLYPTLLSQEKKDKLDKELEILMVKLDSLRNISYTEALIKTKVAIDLGKKTNEDTIILPQKNKRYNAHAEYLTGDNGLREELIKNFYTHNLIGKGTINATIKFVVEEDGRINKVNAIGYDREFNKQAEIAMYLMSFYFSPAYRRGKPVKSYYSIPIKINLE